MQRNFVFSCNVFGYWATRLEVSQADTLDTLTQRTVQKLGTFLQEHHLDWLGDQLRAKKQTYHIHSATLDQILDPTYTSDVFICSCHQQP